MEEDQGFTPRNYQVRLMETAVRQNTIIYLPTGAGKTFIAIMALKRMSESLSRPYSDNGKITVFLVNTVALVNQHAKYLSDHTIFSVGAFSGDLNTDHWSSEKWLEQFNKYQILVMTSQIFVNLLETNYIDLAKVNLIIFDECHRGVEDHPMRQIMKKFQLFETDKSLEAPRILGLTATLLNRNCSLHKVMEQVNILETTFHSTVATADGLQDVVGFSTNPIEEFKIFQPPAANDLIKLAEKQLEEVIETLKYVKLEDDYSNPNICLSENLVPLNTPDVLRRLKNFISDIIIHINILGIYGAYKTCIVCMIQIERLKKHADDIKNFYILNYVMSVIGCVKEKLKCIMANYSDKEKLQIFSSDKMLKLFEILKEYQTKSSEELCGLIFVQRRRTAKIIYHILSSLAAAVSEFNFIKPNFIVGNNNNPYNDTREQLFLTKKNRETLDAFISKECNILISSSVLEEGVDIPKCTLVVKFDKPEDYRSYIQSKGRARHRSSLYYIMVDYNDTQKFFQKYANFQSIENQLNDFLVGKSDDREGPSEDDISDMYNEDHLPPYFVNGPNSAHVTMTAAISLVNRYCNSIPRDSYTTYAPEWYLDKKSGSVTIVFPVVCPLYEPIVGPPMKNKRSAKKAAALYACIELHKCGELDDSLLPVKRQLKEQDVSYLFAHWPDEVDANSGFKKKKRLYEIKIADCVKGSITENSPVYLHIIKIEPCYKRSENFDLATVFDLIVSPLRFGLISAKPFPDNLFSFPLYDSTGELLVEIKSNVKTVQLSKEQIKELRKFHYLIFNDLLEVLKGFLVFDNSGCNADMLLVVPVQDYNNDPFIDFSIIDEHKALKIRDLEPTSTERMNIEVLEETYLHKIVSPWYRAVPSMYVVTRVCTEKTPRSPFPNYEFIDFVDYYEKKHSLRVLNQNQPLLLVKGLSNRLNAFKPGGLAGKRKRDKRYEELEEYLVPEFVVKQEFPAALWIQSRFLPCILSRLSFMLKLQQLQYEITCDLRGDLMSLRNCPKLELDEHLLKYESLSNKEHDSVDTSMSEVSPNNLFEIQSSSSIVTRQFNKDFAMKLLEADYPWSNIEEPKDIERELNVNVLDIEQYEEFISQRPTLKGSDIGSNRSSPTRSQNLPAITYHKDFQEKTLKFLSLNYNGQAPNLCQFYKALTSAEANDIVNLERLETLGDSFLKVIASLHIYCKFPKYNEGLATALKGKLVSNKNLCFLAMKKKLGGILRNRQFSPAEDWVPPGFCAPSIVSEAIINSQAAIKSLFDVTIDKEEQISGELHKTTIPQSTLLPVEDGEENSFPSMCHFIKRQYIGDKTLADCVEALLGAYFESGGFEGATKFAEWIGIIPKSECVLDLIKNTTFDPLLDKSASLRDINFHIPQWQYCENCLGYQFKNRAYLLQALTHASYSSNRLTQSYEKLEFIGDAIIDFLITCYIFEECGSLTPGQVTDLRSALVNNNVFASLAVRCGFHKLLLMVNKKLQEHIDKFAEYFAAKNYVIDDEVLILLQEQDLNLAEYIDVPKVLGDIFEAMIGAVYLDSGKDFKTVWRVFYRIMWKEIDLFTNNVPINIIRKLYETPGAYPIFRKEKILQNKVVMVALDFMSNGRQTRVHGFGSNKTMAKRAAAKIALRSMNIRNLASYS